MRNPAFSYEESKGLSAPVFFHYIDSTIPLLPKSEISSLYPSSVAKQSGLCQPWLEI